MCDLFSPLEACRILSSCSEVHDEVRWCDWAVRHCPCLMGYGGLTVSDTCIHAVLLAHPAPQPVRNFQSLSLLVALFGSLLASLCSHYHLWQSPQTVPGTEALCKGKSKEKESLEVQGVGWVPAWVPTSLGRLGWPTQWARGESWGRCGWHTPGRRRWGEGLETDFPFFQWVSIWKSSVRRSTDLLFSLFQDISFVWHLNISHCC